MSHPDDSTDVSTISKAELVAQTFALSSMLDDSGFIPSSSPPSEFRGPFHYDY